jgi:hypothetical protein
MHDYDLGTELAGQNCQRPDLLRGNMSDFYTHQNSDIQNVLQIFGSRDAGQDVLDIGIVHMIGYAYGRIAQNLCPANQLTGDELAIAEDGVSVQIDHIPPAETRLSIKHYPQKIFVAK